MKFILAIGAVAACGIFTLVYALSRAAAAAEAYMTDMGEN